MNFESFFEKFPKFLNINREAISKWHPLGSLDRFNSPLKKASLTGFHATAKHIAAKAVSPSSETMRTI